MMNKEFSDIGQCEVIISTPLTSENYIKIRLSVFSNTWNHTEFFITKNQLSNDDKDSIELLNYRFRLQFFKLRRLINYGF